MSDKETTVAQTVAEKFMKMPDRDKAYVMGYLLGKEAERAEKQNEPA